MLLKPKTSEQQGNIEDIYPKNTLTLSEALKLEFGSTNVSIHCEGDFDDKEHYNVDFNQVDEEVIILCLGENAYACLLYTSPSPRDAHESRMPSSA